MSGIGHNGGPTLEGGYSWRKHVWTKARADLLPTLPIEVLRRRVARAKELGLPYRTYASVRASTGRDVVGFLFSTNALRLLRNGDALPEERARQLVSMVDCTRVALAHPPIDPARLTEGRPIDLAHRAPSLVVSWSAMRQRMGEIIREDRLPADGLLVVGETALERDWAEAGRTAGYLSGAELFGA